MRNNNRPLDVVKIIQYGVSDGAQLLREALGIRRLVRSPDQIPREWKLINWGNSTFKTGRNRVLNTPEAVAIGKNKLRTFESLVRAGVSIPEFTTDINVAKAWARDGVAVVQRATVTGKAGQGITIVEKELDITRNPLYTKYVKKKEEWRIHVFNGRVIDFAKKLKTKDDPIKGDDRVRSHLNGYVFSKNRAVIGTPKDEIQAQAIKAVTAVGLDFGGVDVIWNEHHQKAYVLEINTAPGIEGSTVTKYAAAMRKYYA